MCSIHPVSPVAPVCVSFGVTEYTPVIGRLGSREKVYDACNYLRIENAYGYVLIAVYFFILILCMRVTRITQKVLNRIA